MIASIPDLQDTKVKVCINNLFQEELDKINAKTREMPWGPRWLSKIVDIKHDTGQ